MAKLICIRLSVLLLILVFAPTTGNTTDGNRFLNLKQIRCREEKIPQDECIASRQRLLNGGKISRSEHDYLVRLEAVPVFGVDGFPAGYCSCGCFAPFLKILVSEQGEDDKKWMVLSDALKTSQTLEVWTLDTTATLGNFTRSRRQIRTQTAGPESKPMLVIETKSGRELVVTKDHGVLLSTGQMVQAIDVSAGQSLVDYEGHADPVVKVTSRMFSGEVVNLLADGDSLQSHVIFVEGLAVGDIAWQNSLAKALNTIAVKNE